MNLTLLKTLSFSLYFATLAILWAMPGLFDGFSLLLVSFVLAYCGIIVLAQLASALVALSQWCVAASRQRRDETLAAPSVVFETETEAT